MIPSRETTQSPFAFRGPMGLLPTLRRTAALALSILASASVALAGADDEAHDFDALLSHYEAVRQTLVHDSVDGLGDHVRGLDAAVASLHVLVTTGDVPPEAMAETLAAAGLPPELDPETLSHAGELLGAMHDAAGRLVTAAAEEQDLVATRDAFYELSKPLVRYRELLVAGDRPVVAYCPMAKRSWLQPNEEIGNPYHGQSMATCGQIVAR